MEIQIWKFNILNGSKKKRKSEVNGNEHKEIYETMKAILSGRFIAINAYIKNKGGNARFLILSIIKNIFKKKIKKNFLKRCQRTM